MVSSVRRVLITGGSGFVGCALAREFAENGWQVTATHRRVEPPSVSVRWVRWNALEEPCPKVDWNEFDAVVHLAHPSVVKDGSTQNAVWACAVEATRAILSGIGTRPIRFVYVSSGDALGHTTAPAEEEPGPYRPVGFYGAAKACGEILTLSAVAPSTAVVRLYHPYGPGGEGFMIQKVVSAVRAGKSVFVEGKSGIRMNPVWIGDAVRLLRSAAGSDAKGVFHAAGSETVTMSGFLDRIETKSALRAVRVSVDREPVECHAGQTARSNRILGFDPRIGITEGLERVW